MKVPELISLLQDIDKGQQVEISIQDQMGDLDNILYGDYVIVLCANSFYAMSKNDDGSETLK